MEGVYFVGFGEQIRKGRSRNSGEIRGPGMDALVLQVPGFCTELMACDEK